MSQRHRTRLGPFDLIAPIGQGGMGVVWRAKHRAQGVHVAVKVLTTEGARSPRFRAAFRAEVRAAAGLNHPHIVRLIEYGEVSPEAALESKHQLPPNSPYLVMELVHGSTLHARCGRLSWPDIREVLLALLDALAHAHARGVVHRDIKPGNVLLGEPGGGRRVIKLVDFGLAHLAGQSPRQRHANLAGGTPLYMAPEQNTGRWQDFGPSTDLYSLGQLALALVWGPLGEPRTASMPAAPQLPEGFYDWVTRMILPDPTERFTRAADAALALVNLWSPDTDTPSNSPSYPGDAATSAAVTCALSGLWEESTSGRTPKRSSTAPMFRPPGSGERPALTRPLGRGAGRREPSGPAQLGAGRPEAADRLGRPMPRIAPKPPASWVSLHEPEYPRQLRGLGLGLYGLRAVPLVGREQERELLWSALLQVHRERLPRIVVLHGPAGCGKSRLAQWLSERAHELGSAQVLQVGHRALGGSTEGLAPAVSRALGCFGLSRPLARRHVESKLRARGVKDPTEWQALTDIVAPLMSRDQARVVRFDAPRERHAVVRRFLATTSKERPWVAWLDDAQWGADSLEFVHFLLESWERLPMVVVLTVCNEDLVRRPREAELLRTLYTHPRVQQVELGPLPAPDHAALVRELLGLDEELATQVEQRSAGNPMFAVQLVGDLVHRGLLEAGPRGYRLRSNVNIQLPEALHLAWSTRINQLLTPRTTKERVALELAAVLGQDVDSAEWQAACASLELPVPSPLVETLLAQALAKRFEGHPGRGWSFAHSMLRECLLQRARDGGRWPQLNQACAEVLTSRMLVDTSRVDGAGAGLSPLTLERLASHRLAAGDFRGALEPLMDCAEARLRLAEHGPTERLLSQAWQVLQQLALPADDPHRARCLVLRGWQARELGELDQARTLQERVLKMQLPAHGRALEVKALSEPACRRWPVRSASRRSPTSRHPG